MSRSLRAALTLAGLLTCLVWPFPSPSRTFVGSAAFAAGSQRGLESSPQVGRDLFLARCASCHGAEATGTAEGPPLLGVGAAMVDFQLRTGRMPLTDPGVQPERKPRVFTDDEIEAVVAYVASLEPGGPPIPTVDAASGDLALGQSLFVANCAPCHGATATGGAVGKGALAPSLSLAAPIEVAEAMVVGPGEMPVFDFSAHERDSIVRFIDYLEDRPDRGGADIGGVGPVPEGFVAWGIGMGACFAIALLVGNRGPKTQDPNNDRTDTIAGEEGPP